MITSGSLHAKNSLLAPLGLKDLLTTSGSCSSSSVASLCVLTRTVIRSFPLYLQRVWFSCYRVTLLMELDYSVDDLLIRRVMHKTIISRQYFEEHVTCFRGSIRL